MIAIFKKIYKRLNTFLFVNKKISVYDLRGFAKKVDVKGKTLIVYIEFEFEDLIKDYDILPHYTYDTDRYYALLAEINANSYEAIICTGLLEHMSDPLLLVQECHRILKTDGKLYLSASAMFSVHRGPENYYHLTQYGAKHLFEKFAWKQLHINGSCKPFRTLGINMQRILLQSEVFFLFRPFIELLAWSIPILDFLIIKQYDGRKHKPKHLIDSMLPSNIQVIAQK